MEPVQHKVFCNACQTEHTVAMSGEEALRLNIVQLVNGITTLNSNMGVLDNTLHEVRHTIRDSRLYAEDSARTINQIERHVAKIAEPHYKMDKMNE